jgi:uncharacterized protein GlcG (DUF336 family)
MLALQYLPIPTGDIMNNRALHALLLGTALMIGSTAVPAQTATPYGAPLTLDQARKAMAAAEAEAAKNNFAVAIAIVDSGGHPVLFQRLDSTAYGSVDVAIQKARGASAFRRPTKAFQDLIAQGGEHVRLLNLTGDASVLEGGVPIVVNGKLVGAIGTSGVTSKQDAQVSQAGADALK